MTKAEIRQCMDGKNGEERTEDLRDERCNCLFLSLHGGGSCCL